MTDADRNELLEALGELSRQYPDWRMGQLICNVAGWSDVEVWDLEDGELLEVVRNHLNALRATVSSV